MGRPPVGRAPRARPGPPPGGSIAAFERSGSSNQPLTYTVAYIARAVSPGRYVQPAAVIEDMYRPDRFGRTAFGTVDITSAR